MNRYWRERVGLLAILVFCLTAPARSQVEMNTGSSKPASAKTSLTVVLHDQAPYFNPKRVHIARGSTVVWENRGPALVHTIFINTAEGAVHSGSIKPGQSWSFTFADADDAVIKTFCEVHPYMFGIVIVGNPPNWLISSIESALPSEKKANNTTRIREFPLPIPHSVPGIISIDSEDNIWFTMGGGGFGNISYPALNKVGKLTIDGDLSVYSLPTEASGPSGLAVAPDGSIFVTELFGNKLAHLDARKHSIEEYPIPTPDAWPTGLSLRADGSVWFNCTKSNRIAWLTVEGLVRELPIPTNQTRSTGMVTDQNGDIWIAERDADKIGRLRLDGTFLEYSLPTKHAKPTGMAIDSQGRIWFAERDADKIGVIEGDRVREYPLPSAHSAPFFPVIDRDGKVWFTEIFGNRIGMLEPSDGKVVEYEIPTSDSWPLGLAIDSEGNIWFSEQLGNKIGVMLRGSTKEPSGAVALNEAQRGPTSADAAIRQGKRD